MKIVLITGALGQDGVILSKLYQKKNFKVFGFVKTKQKDVVKKVIYKINNLKSKNKIKNHLQVIKPSIIVHLASTNNSYSKRKNKKNYKVNYAQNLKCTQNLLNSVVENKLKTTKREKAFDKIQSTPVKPKLIIEKSNINKKLKKGKIPINKKIDFHGCGLEEAKEIFLNTIDDCFLKNHRCILFITGKGASKRNVDNNKENKLYYGQIRSDFINCTAHSSVQSKILNIQQASFEHGGDGAFFVYLRKNKN